MATSGTNQYMHRLQHCVDSKYLSQLSFAIVEFDLENKLFDILMENLQLVLMSALYLMQ